ncbi:MAG: hypothetical protein PWP32_529 [Methanothermobacter sp.]|jgi:hypothetical protein|uniref:Uncharacterized protein n=2 Tax=Methanobacteriaceae TaxID=2159 RepID=A0A371NAS7_9EURY|nr:hypothetical protein [Methanothermobacter sp.]REE25264.1 hypothetical protein C7452_1614 [Methanothermobacter defluvii]
MTPLISYISELLYLIYMMWIVTAYCDLCRAKRTLEVEGKTPPYHLGDRIEECPCGGKYVVEEIIEV